MRKVATKKELLVQIEARLAKLRTGYIDPDRILRDTQMRDCMWRALGEITALEEVKMILIGQRRTFIC